MELSTKILLKQLLNTWGAWEENKDYYISELFPELINEPAKGNEIEIKLLTVIKTLITNDEINHPEKYLEEIHSGNYSIDDVIEEIRTLVSNGDFNKADELFNQFAKLSINTLLPYKFNELKNDFRKKIIGELNILLREYNFDRADSLYTKYGDVIKITTYDEVRGKYLNIRNKEKMLCRLEDLLKVGEFLNADKFFEENKNMLPSGEYEKIKEKYIQKDLDTLSKELGMNYGFDKEKANVLSVTGKNILIQARAGSGKTTTVALKVHQLVNNYGIKPEEILVLAFNRKATTEFRDKINEYCGKMVVDSSNSSTFHSLAYQIVKPAEKLLFNDSKIGSEFVRGQQSEFIGEIYNQLLSEDRNTIMTFLYNFFKAIPKEKEVENFNNKHDFYIYRRNLHYVSLGGDRVKSKAEKYIADFLFEHKIYKDNQFFEIKYEWKLPSGTKYYKPDFSFWVPEFSKGKKPFAILEHFGVTKKHPADREYMSEYEENNYLRGIDWAKNYCSQNNIVFIPSSVDDFDGTTKANERGQFEQTLKDRLEKNGLVLKKLSKDEIINKMLQSQPNLNPLFDQITQFINRAKKQLLTATDIQNLMISNEDKLGDRVKNFTEIVWRVYERYQKQLIKDDKIDFDDLLIKSIEIIKQTKGNCNLEFFGETKPIKSLRYILIDEYQDISPLFYGLISSIREANQSINFFCVGDDWQAINSFAGSDLEFYSNFDNYFKSSRKASLLTNHRSCSDIVKHSNLVMVGLGEGGVADETKSKGEIFVQAVPYVEWRTQPECQKEFLLDEPFRVKAKSLGCWQNREIEVSRYLKNINNIILEDVDKEICLLFRTNNFYGIDIGVLQNKIKGWYQHSKKIICSTVHSYKGKESEVVIVVDANRRNYPKIHPDCELSEILGVTVAKIIEEERHLFYVAITRAKERLYMLYEDDLGRSDFIPSQWKFDKPKNQ